MNEKFGVVENNLFLEIRLKKLRQEFDGLNVFLSELSNTTDYMFGSEKINIPEKDLSLEEAIQILKEYFGENFLQDLKFSDYHLKIYKDIMGKKIDGEKIFKLRKALLVLVLDKSENLNNLEKDIKK